MKTTLPFSELASTEGIVDESLTVLLKWSRKRLYRQTPPTLLSVLKTLNSTLALPDGTHQEIIINFAPNSYAKIGELWKGTVYCYPYNAVKVGPDGLLINGFDVVDNLIGSFGDRYVELKFPDAKQGVTRNSDNSIKNFNPGWTKEEKAEKAKLYRHRLLTDLGFNRLGHPQLMAISTEILSLIETYR